MSSPSGGRVVAAHAVARRAFVVAAVFGVVALVWAIVVVTQGGSWWGPLHAFVAGVVLLAISGASVMFTVTWSAAPAPSARTVGVQRWMLAGGVALVLIGVSRRLDSLVWVGAAAAVTGLSMLAFVLVTTIRKSLLRRFGLAARFYLLALGCGVVGISLGAMLATGAAGEQFADWRLAHLHLNLIGLVGFTIVGTIPTFLPTTAHHRAVSGGELALAWWVCLAAAVAMATGAFLGPLWVGIGSILAGVAGALVLGGILPATWSKGWRRLAYLQVSLGVAWLAVWSVDNGVTLILDRSAVVFGGAVAAAVVVGVGQVLLGSLAYLVPVLKGVPLADNQRRMAAVPYLPLLLANLGGVAIVLGWGSTGLVLAGLWLLDFMQRLVRVLAASPLPDPQEGERR